MTTQQAILKTKLDTAIEAMRNLIIRDELDLDSKVVLAIAEAHLRHHRAVLEAAIAKG